MPVYAIGGWADSYSNAIPRLLAGLDVPAKGLIGPWGHQYPHQGHPLPKAGFLQDALRWWDHWLKDIDTGMMDEPAYRVWMQEYAPPASYLHERPGRWVAEDSWPSPRIELRKSQLIAEVPTGDTTGAGLILSSPQSTGMTVQNWIHGGAEGLPDEPIDQRADDANSLVFDSEPLSDPVEILGAPSVAFDFLSDKPNAFVCVRLNEVTPDGTSARVSYATLNLTHLNGHEAPQPLIPGQTYSAEVKLNDIAHSFAAGNRIRVAISTAYWPLIWPSPEPVCLTLLANSAILTLPVRTPSPEDAALPALPPAEQTRVDPRTTLREAAPLSLHVDRDFIKGTTRITKLMDHGGVENDRTGWRTDTTTERIFEIGDLDPLSARFESTSKIQFGRDQMPEIRIETSHELTATESDFCVVAKLSAFEDGKPVFEREWDLNIPRDHI